MFEEIPFLLGFIILSSTMIRYLPSPLNVIIFIFSVVGVILHELCHLILCVITRTPVEQVSIPDSLSPLKSLTIGITNSEGHCTEILDPSTKNWEQLLKFQVFWKNRDNINTGWFYRNIKELLRKEGCPNWANAETIDFTIPPYFLAPSAKILNHENLGSFSNSEKDIVVGNWVRNGVKVSTLRYMQPEDLTHHLFITGGTGTGKTYYCAHLIRDIKTKYPQDG